MARVARQPLHRRPYANRGFPPRPLPVGGRSPRKGWRSQTRYTRRSRPTSRASATAWAKAGSRRRRSQTASRLRPAAFAACAKVDPSRSFRRTVRPRQSKSKSFTGVSIPSNPCRRPSRAAGRGGKVKYEVFAGLAARKSRRDSQRRPTVRVDRGTSQNPLSGYYPFPGAFLSVFLRFRSWGKPSQIIHKPLKMSNLCWRRRWESNPRMEVLQTSALPLGYSAIAANRAGRTCYASTDRLSMPGFCNSTSPKPVLRPWAGPIPPRRLQQAADGHPATAHPAWHRVPDPYPAAHTPPCASSHAASSCRCQQGRQLRDPARSRRQAVGLARRVLLRAPDPEPPCLMMNEPNE